MRMPSSLKLKYNCTIAAAAVSLFASPLALAAGAGQPLGPAIDISIADSVQTNPAIARNASGAMVVAWEVNTSVGSQILAQRLDAAGSRQDTPFQVNQGKGFARQPTVTINDRGDFVIAWVNAFTTLNARRFAADGTPQSDVMTVSENANSPSVAMDDDGDFVVAWASRATSFGGSGLECSYSPIACFSIGGSTLRARRFSATGQQARFENIVDLTASLTLYPGNGFYRGSYDDHPSLAMSHDGSFAVAWDRVGNTLDSGVYLRRFDAKGLPGLAQRVAPSNSGRVALPRAASNGRNSYVVSYAQPDGIHAQIYGPLGLATGRPQLVEDTPSPGDTSPAVSMDAAGDFVVAWPFKAQRFASGGGKLGVNFEIDSTRGASPTVASDAAGNFAFAWSEDDHAIKVRLFQGP